MDSILVYYFIVPLLEKGCLVVKVWVIYPDHLACNASVIVHTKGGKYRVVRVEGVNGLIVTLYKDNEPQRTWSTMIAEPIEVDLAFTLYPDGEESPRYTVLEIDYTPPPAYGAA